MVQMREITERQLRREHVETRHGLPVAELSPLLRPGFVEATAAMALFRSAPASTAVGFASIWTRSPPRTSAPVDEGQEPPGQVRYELEDACEALATTDHLAEVALLEEQIQSLSHELRFDEDGEVMAGGTPLRAALAARQLGVPTKDLLRLVYQRKIRYVMLDGIAHIPADVVAEHRSGGS